MIYLSIDEPYQARVKPELLEQAAWATLQHQGISLDASISIVITGDTQMHQLNLQFVGVDEPTDVLSFPAGYTDPDTHSLYLGDILISYPRAHEQAEKANNPVESELQLLVVHGILHLAGHDHVDSQDKALMWAAQSEILTSLGNSNTNIPD
jgi:rRNA maturation RNase YbeY